MEKLDFNTKHPTSYCIPDWMRNENIKLATRKVKARLQPSEQLQTEPIAIVGYGPSLNDTWEEIKNFNHIITCSGSHKFLLEKGLMPSMFKNFLHVDVDPRAHKVQLLGQPQHGIKYLIASACHPQYFKHLEGYDVTLWHIFANDEESMRILPHGEWAVSGGSDAGMRAMTIARFLGFTDQHIFGLDGSSAESGKHAGFHPNQAKQNFETEYNGKIFLTTPALLECAKGIFHELNQLVDVKYAFYGNGLVQEMAKQYIPNRKKEPSLIAFNKPELISEEYRMLNAKLHEDNVAYGTGGGRHAETVIKLYKSICASSILDYGCGKGMLAKALPMPIWEYDPSIEGKQASPKPADLTCCFDVLEHIEPDKLDYVLDDLRRCVKNVGYFVISTRAAIKTYSNGENTHLVQKGKDWWRNKLKKFFTIGRIIEKSSELHVVVGVKKDVLKMPVKRTNGKLYNI